MTYSKFSTTLFLSLLSLYTVKGQESDTSNTSLRVVEQDGLPELLQTFRLINDEKGGIDGYRVQIYNGRKRACMDKRLFFIKSYPNTSIEMVYEAPEYRVQVGDYRTPLEAEKFLKTINDEFTGSFVVKTIIKLPKLDSKQ